MVEAHNKDWTEGGSGAAARSGGSDSFHIRTVRHSSNSKSCLASQVVMRRQLVELPKLKVAKAEAWNGPLTF